MKHTRLILILTAVLTGCAAAPAADIPETASVAVTATEAAGSAAAIPAASEDTAAGLTLDDAKKVFSDTHPDIPIEVAKLEGDAYYIEGREGNKIYKMKIGTASGTVYLDKTITTNRH